MSPVSPPPAPDDVLIERRGRAGLLTLNRPQALNALTHGMVRTIGAQVRRWADDPAVERVVIRGAGERAFCAGGDIRFIHDIGIGQGRKGAPEQVDFFADEYRLNAALRRYPKPVIALIDGIVMGGGVGVSIHGSHRVATERMRFAMPEVGIGFFPDVGGTYLLSRLPDEIGTYLGLTGGRIGQADALAVGLATHGVASADLGALTAALVEADEPVEAILARFTHDPGPSALRAAGPAIADWFGRASVEAILSALECAEGPHAALAAKAAADMRAKSPTSLMIALHQMRIGRDLAMDACMVQEFRIVNRVLRGHDFYEGIRAAILDKGSLPRWQPDALSEVDPADIAAHFSPPASGDLDVSGDDPWWESNA